ncbi:MAG: hypothetical protein HDS38_04055 [Bacteroides sp.]|nr:hypothetical protein [Bacteroides sp.]
MAILHSNTLHHTLLLATITPFTLLTSTIVFSANNESAVDRLNYQVSIYPQEKLHVVTDRDIYCGGDTVWLRVFVADAVSHRPIAMSKYAYVELLNPFGIVQKRVKLMERDGVYAGYIPVDEDIYDGDYTLNAYTAYAENQGKDYFFRKNLRILPPYTSKYVIESRFDSIDDGEVKGNFTIRAINGENLNYNAMSWTMPDGKFLEMPDSKKGITRKFHKDKGEDVVLVKFGDYGRYVPIEYPNTDTELSFYPEGGWLIADEPCRVAFKATGNHGTGVDASGVIRDDTGEEIARFSTSHCGMGSVTFVPEAGHVYTAEYIGQNGQLQTTEIGSPKEGAAALRYSHSGTKSTFSIAGGKDKDLRLVLALRGSGMVEVPISVEKPLSIEEATLPTGLYQALLFSPEDSAVMSERLFFIGSDRKTPQMVQLKQDSTCITLKPPVSMTGDCSLRIINSNIVSGKADSEIMTQFLLQSELRGRIENPSYYFNDVDSETQNNLDLLMMVNGWSRYNLPDAMQGKYEEPEVPLEIGQEISGQVRSRWKNSPMEGVLVSAIAPKWNFGTFAETDSDGIFRLNGFDFPEGTPFILKSMNAKGGLEANYDVFEDRFPKTEILRTDDSIWNTDDISDFLNSTKWILLDEVKVQAFKENNDDIYANFASFSSSADDMKVRGIKSIGQALRGIGGIFLNMDRLIWRGTPVSYYIDGQIFDPRGSASISYNIGGSSYGGSFGHTEPTMKKDDFYSPSLSEVEAAVPFKSIERIDFIRPEHSLVVGPSYGGPIVLITTKTGDKKNWSRQFELKDYLPLGYQQYKEYASPLLSVDSDEYDLQTSPTLLWMPSVRFDDAGKSIDLKFPVKPEYRVIIEGLSDNGDIISETL